MPRSNITRSNTIRPETIRPSGLSPDKARRQLRHLCRLRDKISWWRTVLATTRGSVGFAATLAALKLLAVKSLGLKIAAAASVGLAFATPMLAIWIGGLALWIFGGLVIAVVATLIIAAITAIIFGEAAAPDLIDVGDVGQPDSWKRPRREPTRLDKMIAHRESVIANLPDQPLPRISGPRR
ncbi:MAG: hypothetical protein ABL898_17120 [Hyphomicrobiaceae bacterium]